MTREEAIKMLKSKMDGHTDTSYEWAETVRMAIKALEQELCEDCISRQAVLDEMKIRRDNGDMITVGFIKGLPSVNLQPNTEVLDKVRAEIIEEKDFAYADFERYKVEYLGVDAEYVEDELPQDDFRYGMERAIDLIDKYKK